MNLNETGRVMRTVAQLRPSQLWWRARFMAERRLAPRWAARVRRRPGNTERNCPDWQLLSSIPLLHREGVCGRQAVYYAERGEFHHLNVTQKIGAPPIDWITHSAAGRLWEIMLHYHGWVYNLAEAACDGDRRALPLLESHLENWLEHASIRSIGSNNLVWNSYAVATRLGWWVRALALLESGGVALAPAFRKRMLESLVLQAEFLSSHIERDLRGNHLLRDALGLAWAARCVDAPSAREWLDLASTIAQEQAAEQILSDGGHFERSPMYHLHVMEDLLALALLLPDAQVRAGLRATWSKMADFLAWVRYPDGDIPLLNDAALNAASAPLRMLQAGESLSVATSPIKRSGGCFLPATGMVVWHDPCWSLFFDVGTVGPDYQPGHAHADTLTLDCSLDGQRLFVDPGCYGYDRDARRAYDRSTDAHNTVCIDQQDSSEVWHVFRVGRRARPCEVETCWSNRGGVFEARGSHTGYAHLYGSPSHHRAILLDSQGSLRVVDRIDGEGTHDLAGGWLLWPDWTATDRPAGWKIATRTTSANVHISGPDSLTLHRQTRPIHPQFGQEFDTTRLAWRCRERLPVEVVMHVERGG